VSIAQLVGSLQYARANDRTRNSPLIPLRGEILATRLLDKKNGHIINKKISIIYNKISTIQNKMNKTSKRGKIKLHV
jgi:hypothetical protein